MKTETWTCDWCGVEMPGEPALLPCIREPATGEILFEHQGCQKCFDKFLAMLDPDKSQRNKMQATLGRSIQFRVHPPPRACGCKSALKCPHGGG